MAAPVDRRLLAASARARTHLLAAGAIGVLCAAVVAQAALLAYVIDRSAMRDASLASAARGADRAGRGARWPARCVNGAFDLSGRSAREGAMSELREGLVARLLLRQPRAQHPPASAPASSRPTAVQGVDALESYFAGYLPQLVLAALVPLAVIAWIAPLDPLAAGILALTVPILVAFMVLIGKGARAQTRRRWRALRAARRALPRRRAAASRPSAPTAASTPSRGPSPRRRALPHRNDGRRCAVAFLSALVLELCAMIGTALVAATIGVQLVGGAAGAAGRAAVLLLAPELYAPLRLVGQQFHASADAHRSARADLRSSSAPSSSPATRARRAAPDPARCVVRMQGLRYSYPERARWRSRGSSSSSPPGASPRSSARAGPARALSRVC